MARDVVEEYKNEMEHYQAYKDYYNYGFYIARKDM